MRKEKRRGESERGAGERKVFLLSVPTHLLLPDLPQHFWHPQTVKGLPALLPMGQLPVLQLLNLAVGPLLSGFPEVAAGAAAHIFPVCVCMCVCVCVREREVEAESLTHLSLMTCILASAIMASLL